VKAVLAQFLYESNTFNTRAAELENFTAQGIWLTDPAAIRRWASGNPSQLAGSLDALNASGAETHPVFVATCGTPGGRLSAACHQHIRDTLRDCLQAALPANVLVLHLHGAVCATGEDDVEGQLLTMIREELGFTGRIVVSLDLHAQLSATLLQQADDFTAYRTFPHQDFYETGQRAAQLALNPVITTRHWARIPAIIPPTATDHRQGHFAALLRHARLMERLPGIRNVELFPVQPWLDIDGLCSSVLVTATIPLAGAQAARQLAASWWRFQESWNAGLLDWPDIIRRLQEPADQPWLLVDTADATTGGSPGHSAEALAQLWLHRHDLPGSILLWVVDPSAVKAACSGTTILNVGQQIVPFSGQLTFTGECRFTARGRAYTGQTFSCGSTAVLQAGQIHLVLTSEGCLCADPAFYECLGLNPAQALAVQVKSHMGWQAGYQCEPSRGLRFDGPGTTSLNFARMPYTGERRLLHPFNSNPDPLPPWQSS
jgi:microcystin degradation protein MlrC